MYFQPLILVCYITPLLLFLFYFRVCMLLSRTPLSQKGRVKGARKREKERDVQKNGWVKGAKGNGFFHVPVFIAADLVNTSPGGVTLVLVGSICMPACRFLQFTLCIPFTQLCASSSSNPHPCCHYFTQSLLFAMQKRRKTTEDDGDHVHATMQLLQSSENLGNRCAGKAWIRKKAICKVALPVWLENFYCQRQHRQSCGWGTRAHHPTVKNQSFDNTRPLFLLNIFNNARNIK